MKKLFIILLMSILCSIASYAEYVQTCKIKYRKNYSWSDYYSVTVRFYAGAELNRIIGTYDFEPYKVYAIVWWNHDECSIIKIESYMACGTNVTQTCINGHWGNLEGEDEEGRKWEICTSNWCN